MSIGITDCRYFLALTSRRLIDNLFHSLPDNYNIRKLDFGYGVLPHGGPTHSPGHTPLDGKTPRVSNRISKSQYSNIKVEKDAKGKDMGILIISFLSGF